MRYLKLYTMVLTYENNNECFCYGLENVFLESLENTKPFLITETKHNFPRDVITYKEIKKTVSPDLIFVE